MGHPGRRRETGHPYRGDVSTWREAPLSALTDKGGTRRWSKLRALWAARLPLPCPRCGALVTADQNWHLDHTDARAEGGADADARPAHARCNLAAGAKLGNERKREKAAKVRAVESMQSGYASSSDNMQSSGDYTSVHNHTSVGNDYASSDFSSRNARRISRASLVLFPPITQPTVHNTAGVYAIRPDAAYTAGTVYASASTDAVDGPFYASAADPAWDGAPWLTGAREVPSTATWPRLMSLPHPSATGSYGAEAIAWSEQRLAKPLRWWQRLAFLRILEHDATGALTWPFWVLSCSRQVGKSWFLREMFLWRIHQAARFGEPQLVLHTAKDLPVCREVMRPARAWAHQQPGYNVREANGQEEIETPDGSRWMVRGRGSIYGYSASLAAVDEAWKVGPDVVEDGLEPTMAERASSQIGLVSTAHRFATGLMQSRRAAAIGQLEEPRDTLLIEWSAPAHADIDDRSAWRMASPHWSDRRELLVEAQHGRAVTGAPSVDPDEPDPLASFRSQWLNIWPPRVVSTGPLRGQALLEEGAWADLADMAALPAGPLVLGLEDWFGQGAAAAATGHLPDGRLFAWGRLFARRSEACRYLIDLAGAHPESRLVIGASLEHDPDAAAIDVESRELAGQSDTRVALPLLRELVAANRLAHDGGAELAGQVEPCRVVESRAGGLQPAPGHRTDLLRAAAWALAVLARLPVPEEEPAIF
jgi:hypothetical protein